MELSYEIRCLANEIKNQPMRITLEEVVDRLRSFEELADDIEKANIELQEENEELRNKANDY